MTSASWLWNLSGSGNDRRSRAARLYSLREALFGIRDDPMKIDGLVIVSAILVVFHYLYRVAIRTFNIGSGAIFNVHTNRA
jgi:hypothetical protein